MLTSLAFPVATWASKELDNRDGMRDTREEDFDPHIKAYRLR